MPNHHGRVARLTALCAAGLFLAGGAAAQEKPYRTDADARKDLTQAQERARTLKKSVMVIFGANWCEDCLVLHRNLDAPANHEYVQRHFEIVSVDVGQFDKNLDVAKSLGVDLAKGIPVAAFLDSGGKTIGNTNKGELEPSRKYHSDEILRFLHEVVDNRRITVPK